MKKLRLLIVLFVIVAACAGALALAKGPGGGGGGGGTQNCRMVPCAACPEGYVLAPPVWPDCCVCVPAP